ncbi:hypothetical protein DH2020_012591 [Rehmannia glutinosa]|uniref:MACPF domain-containing protein n=1 Tax=Rehmannia glutinosa TaxID=99300 RepID=A0ABR0X2W4_REHGL
MANKEAAPPKLIAVTEAAVNSIGLGFDMVMDCRLKCIKCGKGDRMRFRSDVLSFQQMSEHFNQDMSLSGKIPAGQFNAAFEFSGQWQKDAAYTRALAFDGVFITLYSIELEKSQMVLSEHVKQAVPLTWDPVALTKIMALKQSSVFLDFGIKFCFIDNLERLACSLLELDRIAHGLTFMDSSTLSIYSHKEEITFFWRRRGGSSNKSMSHEKWCQSVKLEPEAISMTYVPISSLLSGIDGSGFLGHAINLYLRYKPPIEALHQFLDFQVPRQWAPEYGDLSLVPRRRPQSNARLQFSFLGRKLYVNTDLICLDCLIAATVFSSLTTLVRPFNLTASHFQNVAAIRVAIISAWSFGVDSPKPGFQARSCADYLVSVGNSLLWGMNGRKPVTGARLYLEGRRSNCLAIHLQHLSSCPKSFQLLTESTNTSARLLTKVITKFSSVSGSLVMRKQEWSGVSDHYEKSGLFSSLISSISVTSQKEPPKPSDININSALYPEGPPVPAAMRELLRFVDTTEMTRGPLDPPGFWVVSGARLVIEKGKICLSIKYSLLTMDLPVEEMQMQG